MGNTLLSRVLAIRRRAEWLVLLHGLGKFLLGSLGLILVLAWIDFWLRPASGLARGLFSSGLLVGLFLLARKWVGPAFAYRASEIVVARRIEARFPALRHQLASSVEFLTQSSSSDSAEQSSGSTALRSAVIEETERKAETLDFRQSLDDRPTRTVLFWAGMAVLGVLFLAFQYPHQVALSAQRLALPWGSARWPLRHQLTFIESPQQIAIGSPLELTLHDQMGKLPDRAWLQIRKGSGFAARVETKEMVSLGEQMVVRLENVTQPLDYRAYGGDDDTMPWTHLVPLEVPKLVALSSEIEPPAYTELPSYAATRLLRVLVGSHWKLQGEADRGLKLVTLRRKRGVPGAPQNASDKPLVSLHLAGAKSFVLPPLLLPAEDFRSMTELELIFTANDGMESPVANLQVTLLPDAPPAILWDGPVNGGIFTPTAIINLAGQIRDDWGVANVELRYAVLAEGENEGIEYSLPLYRRAAVPILNPEAKRPIPPKETGAGEERWQLATTWDLSQLDKLGSSRSLSLRLAAVDTKGQQTLSEPRRINLVSQADFEASLLRRQEAIQRQLLQILQTAESSHAQTRSLLAKWETARGILPTDLNSGQATELLERGLLRGLTQPNVGVLVQLTTLRADITANRLVASPLESRLIEMSQQLTLLQTTQLVPLEAAWGNLLQELREQLRSQTAATPSGDTAATEGDMPDPATSAHASTKTFSPALQQISARQEACLKLLRRLLGTLSQWDSYRRVAQELDHIAQVQEQLHEQLMQSELKRALALPKTEFSAQAFAAEQIELGRAYDKLLAQMSSLEQESLSTLAPAVPGNESERLKESIAYAQKMALGGKMRLAGSQCQAGEGGMAEQTQQEISQRLEVLRKLLAGERAPQPEAGATSSKQENRNEALADLARFVTAAVAEQQRLIQETANLVAALSETKGPETTGLASLTSDQRSLAEELQRTLAKGTLPGSFYFALQGAARQMESAVVNLQLVAVASAKREGQILAGQNSQQAQRRALTRMQAVLLALEAAAEQANPPEVSLPPAAAGDDSATAGSPGQLSPAELFLLKSLQQEIYARTTEVQTRWQKSGKLTLLDQQELDQLAQEQHALAATLLQTAFPATSQPSSPRGPAAAKPEQPNQSLQDALLEGVPQP